MSDEVASRNICNSPLQQTGAEHRGFLPQAGGGELSQPIDVGCRSEFFLLKSLHLFFRIIYSRGIIGSGQTDLEGFNLVAAIIPDEEVPACLLAEQFPIDPLFNDSHVIAYLYSPTSVCQPLLGG